MSRFVSPDLSRLPAPSALEALDFEALVTARLATLKTRADARGFAYDVETLESDPLVVDQQTGAVHELTVRSRVNDAVRAVLLVTATSAQLDHIAATYYGISRLVVAPAAGNQPAVMEADADFRARIALAVEAWSTAGPEGAYIFHALEADGNVLDVAVYSEEDGAVYADSTAVLAPEVLVVVLSRVGNGAPTEPLLAKVFADLSTRDRRPPPARRSRSPRRPSPSAQPRGQAAARWRRPGGGPPHRLSPATAPRRRAARRPPRPAPSASRRPHRARWSPARRRPCRRSAAPRAPRGR